MHLEVIDLGEHMRQTVKAFESAYHREVHFQLQQESIEAVADIKN